MLAFRPMYRRVLNESYREGKLSKKDYDILLDAYKRPNRSNDKGEHINLINEAEKVTRKRGWPDFWKWLKENWLTILKLFLSLLPLFLMVDEVQPRD